MTQRGNFPTQQQNWIRSVYTYWTRLLTLCSYPCTCFSLQYMTNQNVFSLLRKILCSSHFRKKDSEIHTIILINQILTFCQKGFIEISHVKKKHLWWCFQYSMWRAWTGINHWTSKAPESYNRKNKKLKQKKTNSRTAKEHQATSAIMIMNPLNISGPQLLESQDPHYFFFFRIMKSQPEFIPHHKNKNTRPLSIMASI